LISIVASYRISYGMKSVEELKQLAEHYFTEGHKRWPDPPSRGGTAKAASTVS
jgi:hypothetical protein